ncbi:MAG: T9SS type A sorting domain-containing protein [Flavobacteriales bacterium]|nr:T9SS type A sorting domain-containing protein [Flavobacteriales bacterium]
MKKIILPLLFLTISAHAQTGPGGVGSKTNNVLWLDANSLNLNNNDPVSSWTDLSGNNNHAVQATSSKKPVFLTNEINGHPSISFDGSNDVLNISSHITSSAISIYTIYTSSSTNTEGVLTIQKHALMRGNNILYSLSESPGYKHTISKSNGSYSIVQFNTDASASGSQMQLSSGNTIIAQTRNSLLNRGASAIGARITNGGSEGLYLSGKISEVIIFNTQLNSAEVKIINSALESKYNLSTINSNLYSFAGTHSNNIIGIGQESDGSNLSARGMDSLQVSNPSSMSNGDYLLIGNDNAGFSTNTNVETGLAERWNQTWRADVTNTPGTVDLEFFLGANGFASPDDYVLLIENGDGDFTNGGTSIHETGRTFSAIPSPSIKFTGVSLTNGAYFTLAEKESSISSVKSGEWNDVNTWSCTCIPSNTDIVSIVSPHVVEVNSNAEVLNLTLNSGASMTFDGLDTLKIYKSFDINGNFSSGTATVAAMGTSASAISLSNGSNNRIDFNNLYVNSTNGLNLANGGWAISNNLQVSSGGMNVSSADSIVLLSTSSKTSQILPSMSNAFTGDFIVQRYISTRNSGFANISSPITNATFNDLDDDLPISGANGADGNANAVGGGIFYSLYKYNTFSDKHDTITDINEKMVTSRGYEIYLMNTLNTFNAKTIDFIGVPNTGNVKAKYTNIITQGWNLVGNPYHSFVSWDLVKTHTSIPNLYPTYYIFNTDNGAYQQLNSINDPIAPSQAFWVYQPNTGGYYQEFTESTKVNSNSATFLRKKYKNPHFKLKINSLDNSFANELNFNFNAIATSDMDIMDIPNLPSPIQEAPSITAKARNSTEGLILNSLNPLDEHQLIPISVKAGITGSYEINAENLDALFNNYSCAFLKDKATNQSIDLIVEPNYHFEAEKGESDRFELILSNNYDQCHNLLEDNSFIQKLDSKLELRSASNQWFLDYTLSQENTQLSISVYNLAGQEVIAPIEFSANGAGSYAIREIQNLEGIYLIRVISKDGIINKTVKL